MDEQGKRSAYKRRATQQQVNKPQQKEIAERGTEQGEKIHDWNTLELIHVRPFDRKLSGSTRTILRRL
ncbi:hypothetical protein T265_10815 [Opisthorchis viverrini]|uniref:Uncharacterized protein n=1 Tax=Opisthorchis viverrini TaxID=6198 RepID=A0A074ZZY6_OPIVI|nr:hypothetical protein T265_10815 [Opisthorchis viverrini]KER20704.1 hypothetical protein T265_10815 [Opisthorchis viverrini]